MLLQVQALKLFQTLSPIFAKQSLHDCFVSLIGALAHPATVVREAAVEAAEEAAESFANVSTLVHCITTSELNCCSSKGVGILRSVWVSIPRYSKCLDTFLPCGCHIKDFVLETLSFSSSVSQNFTRKKKFDFDWCQRDCPITQESHLHPVQYIYHRLRMNWSTPNCTTKLHLLAIQIRIST